MRIILFLFFTNPTFTFADEIEVLRQRLLEDALAKGFLTRTSDYIESDFNAAPIYLHNLQPNGSWTDINYDDHDNDWHPLYALDRTLVMTYAYKNPADSLYQNPEVLDGIARSLQYWYQISPTCDNWYKNDIGKQFYFNVIALFLQGDIEDALLKNIIADLTPKPTMTGSNRTLLSISVLYRGVLEKNTERIAEGVAGVMQQVQISTDEGIQQDYSFHQHGPFLYNGNYGSNFLRETIWLAAMVQGTQFAFTEEHLRVLRNYYLEGTRWMIRGGALDYNTMGRGVGRTADFGLGAYSQVPQLDHFITADPEFIDQYQASRQHILNQEPQNVDGNRYYWRSDYMVHHRDAYFTSLKMCSERTIGMEMDVNTENLLGYYLPFGMTYIYRRGNEYKDIFPVWDWARLPGVTSPHRSFSMKGRSTQSTSFVGGVSDSTYGVSAMHLDVKDTQAKKAWFWFDEEWVALGAGIQSTNPDSIITGINQSVLKSEVVVDGTIFSGRKKENVQPKWVWQDSIAYIFPDEESVVLQAIQQKGQVQRIFGLEQDSVYQTDVFSLWFEHGLQPNNASYSYIVKPGCGTEEMDKYVDNMPIAILSNTSDIQAVAHKNLNLTGMVFYKAGIISLSENVKVQVDAPCLVLVNSESKTITVSDPTTKLKKLNLTLIHGDGNSETVLVTLPQKEYAGKSVVINKQFKLLGKVGESSSGD